MDAYAWGGFILSFLIGAVGLVLGLYLHRTIEE